MYSANIYFNENVKWVNNSYEYFTQFKMMVEQNDVSVKVQRFEISTSLSHFTLFLRQCSLLRSAYRDYIYYSTIFISMTIQESSQSTCGSSHVLTYTSGQLMLQLRSSLWLEYTESPDDDLVLLDEDDLNDDLDGDDGDELSREHEL